MNSAAHPSARPFGIAVLALAAVGAPHAATPSAAATLGSARPSTFARQPIPASQAQRQAMEAAGKKPLLYLADNFNNQISVFDVTKKQSPAPAYVITAGLNGPQGISTDLSGNLYVANLYGNTVTIYAPGAKSPKATLSQGLSTPVDVKVDSSGNVYVANSPGLGAQSYVAEFLAGNSSPSSIWYTPAGNQAISGIALLNPAQPGQTSIYAAYYTLNGSGYATGGVFSCYPGNSTCVSLGNSFGQTGGVLVEESPGLSKPFDYMVVDQYLPGVDNFQQGAPESQLTTGGTPEFIALNARRTQLFVADSFYNRVTEYAYPSGKVLNHFNPAAGNQRPFVAGVATSPAGTFF